MLCTQLKFIDCKNVAFEIYRKEIIFQQFSVSVSIPDKTFLKWSERVPFVFRYTRIFVYFGLIILYIFNQRLKEPWVPYFQGCRRISWRAKKKSSFEIQFLFFFFLVLVCYATEIGWQAIKRDRRKNVIPRWDASKILAGADNS